jgi:hypothetical protein
MDAVSGYLANWLGLVKAYNDISLNVNDRFLSAYETEFFSDYKIFDADGDILPFDEYHQKLLEYTLEAVEYAIENVGMDADCMALSERNYSKNDTSFDAALIGANITIFMADYSSTSEKYLLVFREGLVREQLKERLVNPLSLEKYKLFCEKLIKENDNADIEQLYRLAHFGLRHFLRDSQAGMPDVKIEPGT